jgi:2-C-methyl-D-erythritol 4-phosphate cytidylyltransferase
VSNTGPESTVPPAARGDGEAGLRPARAGQGRGGVWAVLLAAGRGERLGDDKPKAFARLGDLPMLAEPLRRLDESDWIERIVIAAPPGWEEPCILLAEELGAGKVSSVVAGGQTRTASVLAGLDEVAEDASVVLVHDAARPFLPEEVIERVLAPLSEGWDGVVPALEVSDTVKRVRGDQVVETLDRDELVAVQTPQAFLADALRRGAGNSQLQATDCASLVEAAGGRVRWVTGDYRLLKVTSPADLELVASWL